MRPSNGLILWHVFDHFGLISFWFFLFSEEKVGQLRGSLKWMCPHISSIFAGHFFMSHFLSPYSCSHFAKFLFKFVLAPLHSSYFPPSLFSSLSFFLLPPGAAPYNVCTLYFSFCAAITICFAFLSLLRIQDVSFHLFPPHVFLFVPPACFHLSFWRPSCPPFFSLFLCSLLQPLFYGAPF